MIQEFFTLYHQIFDDNRSTVGIKEDCVRLIKLADQLDPSISHGNIVTGYIFKDAMKFLVQKLQKDTNKTIDW